MMREITILGVGIAIGYFLFRKSDVILPSGVIAPGDKGREIEGMQKAFEKMGNLKFSQYGQYDSDTQAAVQYLMQGTTALKDMNKGLVSESFASDIAKVYFNSKK
jgi:hypothetical protein